MNEISKYEAYKKKLEGICEENELRFRFNKESYPITLTIKPLTGLDHQLSMLENEEEKGYTSPNASIVFIYKDGTITYKTSEHFTISDALFSKIKNLFKNMHYCWLQYFFRNVIERNLLTAAQMPAIDESEANDTDSVPEGAEPLEDFEEAAEEIADEMLEEAIRIVRMENKANTNLLVRRMNILEEQAQLLIMVLEKKGVVGPYNNSEDREVLPVDVPDDVTEEEGVDNE